jgi:hypothetical protein
MRSENDILRQYLSDMVALDGHINEALKRQAEDERMEQFPEARRVISSIKGTFDSHISGLKRQLETLGGEESGPIKEAASTIAGVAAGLYDKVRHDPVSKMLRDDYTALSLASISYTMLHTTALALRRPVVADLALGYLKDVSPFVIELSKVIPPVVVRDLADNEVTVDQSAGQEAVRRTQEAWGASNAA